MHRYIACGAYGKNLKKFRACCHVRCLETRTSPHVAVRADPPANQMGFSSPTSSVVTWRLAATSLDRCIWFCIYCTPTIKRRPAIKQHGAMFPSKMLIGCTSKLEQSKKYSSTYASRSTERWDAGCSMLSYAVSSRKLSQSSIYNILWYNTYPDTYIYA